MAGNTSLGESVRPADLHSESDFEHAGKTAPSPAESREVSVDTNPELSSGGLQGLKALIQAATVDLTSQVIGFVNFGMAWPKVVRGTHCRCIHGQGIVDWSSEDSVIVIHSLEGKRRKKLSMLQSSLSEVGQKLAFDAWFDTVVHSETKVEEAEELCSWVIAMNMVCNVFTEEMDEFLDANGDLTGSSFDLVPNNFARLVCRRCDQMVHLADEHDKELGLPNWAHFRAWLSFNSGWDRLDIVRTTSFQRPLPSLKGWSPDYDTAMEDRTTILDFDPTVDTPVHAGTKLQERPAPHGFNYQTSGTALRSQRKSVAFMALQATVLSLLSTWNVSGLMLGFTLHDVMRHIEFAWFRLREPPRTDPKHGSPYHTHVGKGKLFFEFSGLATFQVKSTLAIPERDDLGRKIARDTRQGKVCALLESRADLWSCATNYSFGAPWMPWQQFKLHNYADAMSHTAELSYVPSLWRAYLKDFLKVWIGANNRYARFVSETNQMTEADFRATGRGGVIRAFRKGHPSKVTLDLEEEKVIRNRQEHERLLKELETTNLVLPLLTIRSGRSCASEFAAPGTMRITGWVHNREEITRL